MNLLESIKICAAPRSFNRYVLVGLVNTSVTFLSFPCFFLFGENLNVNMVLFMSGVFNVLFAFILHRLVTFTSKAKLPREILRFFSLQGCLLILNMLAFNALLQLSGTHPLLVQFFITVVFLGINFFFLRNYVFPKSPV